MGRPRKPGKRGKNDRLVPVIAEPAAHVLAKRELFGFAAPAKGPDGRVGKIDQDICDGIGQFHALGLLDGHGHDPQDLRDIGREWRDGYASLLRKSGYKAGGYERMDKALEISRYTHRDAKFDSMDEALSGFERSVLLSLLIDPVIGSWPDGEENAPWVRSLVGEGLLRRGKIPTAMRFPTEHDRAMLGAAIRGLCILIDAALPSRWEQMAEFRRSAA